MDGGGGGAMRRKTGIRDHVIPLEITEAILLNLPVKSLLRFSSVSKLWNSIIFGPWFVKKYRGSENLVGLQRSVEVSSLTLIPSVPSDNHATTRTTLNCPIEGKPRLRALCDGLLCVEVETSLFLWNPSMRTYRRLRYPPLLRCRKFLYGVGYDAVGDDYKMFRIGLGIQGAGEAEFYSLRSDSWKKIQHFPRKPLWCLDCYALKQCYGFNSLLVNGNLHWLVCPNCISHSEIIISFDLSTEKYGEMTTPEHYYDMRRLVMWTMESYGFAESWSTTFDIGYDHGAFQARPSILTHLKFYDDGLIMIKTLVGDCGALMLERESDKPLILMNSFFPIFHDCFIYIESLISPNMW